MKLDADDRQTMTDKRIAFWSHIQNRLPVTTNQVWRRSRQTGSEVISHQGFHVSTPNSVQGLSTQLGGGSINLMTFDL